VFGVFDRFDKCCVALIGLDFELCSMNVCFQQ